jgi:hypothetical protein
MVSRKGLRELIDNYRFTSTQEETKPYLIQSDIGDFMLEVDYNVILLMLEYFPEEGVGGWESLIYRRYPARHLRAPNPYIIL